MKIIQATSKNLEQLLPLFEGYRTYYKQEQNAEAARSFLKNRLQLKDSVIFLAFDSNKKALGFTQLYPSFSSVSMQRVYILNDLFVSSEVRGKGFGEALLNHAKQFAIENNSKGLILETDIDNPAQKLYERLGWKKDEAVFHYTWEV
ncbi:MAG: GNAT family N-acetyltransferase [Flavobacteriaceae bacterium]|nr:GNAT family N-acetyltransferase [Flavobacteriaceae bacterium]